MAAGKFRRKNRGLC